MSKVFRPTVFNDLISPPEQQVIYQQLLDEFCADQTTHIVSIAEHSLSLYQNGICQLLHHQLQAKVEQAVGCSVLPSFAYARIYLNQAQLVRHFDRPACEISATLCVAIDAKSPWPIYAEVDGEVLDTQLNPGDMMVYMGREHPHWRDAFEGNFCLQVILCYVVKDGPYHEHAGDSWRLNSVGEQPVARTLDDVHARYRAALPGYLLTQLRRDQKAKEDAG